MNCRYRKLIDVPAGLPAGYTPLQWVESTKIASKIFDGTESFVSNGILDNCWACIDRVDTDTSFTLRKVLTTHYRNSDTLPAGANRQGCALLGKVTSAGGRPIGKYIGFGATEAYPTESAFKAMLASEYSAGHPVTAMFEIATAVSTPNKFYAAIGGGNYPQTYIPAKNSSNVAGLYCVQNASFITGIGNATFTAGPTVYSRIGGRYRRGLFVNGKFYKVPSDVTPMTYVKGSGSAYIKTPLTSYKNTYKYKLGIKRYAITTKFVSFQNPSENENTIGMFANYFGYAVQNGRNTRQTITVSAGSFHDIVIESDGYSVDGTKTTVTPVSEFTVNSNLYLFAGCNDTTIDNRISDDAVSYYYVEDSSGNLLMALIPATKNSIVGVFDLVSQTFIAPHVGTLTAGTALTKDQIYHSVEKIERKDGNVYKEIPLGFARSVSGASPLTVPDARALTLSKLELQGNVKRGIKIDGVVHPIPDGITLLSYAVFDGSTYIETGIIPGGKKIGAIVDFQFTNASRSTGGMVGSNETDNTNNCQFTVYESKWRVKINNYATYGARYDTNRHTLRLNTPNGTGLDDTVYTATQYTVASSNTNEMYFGACNYDSGSTLLYSLIGKLYSALFYDDTTLIRAYIPAIQNNVVGYYDFVTQQFIAPTGGTLTAGPEAPTPDCPLEILGVGDKTEQLIDLTKVTNGYYYNDTGVYTATSDARLTDWIEAKAGESFTFVSILGRVGTPKIRMCFFDENQNYISQQNTNASTTLTATAPDGTKHVRISVNYQGNFRIDWSGAVLVKGSTVPASYIPYGYEVTLTITDANNNPQTITIHTDKPLFKSGNYTDLLEAISGVQTNKWGVKVLDGSDDEGWTYDSSYSRFYTTISDVVNPSLPRSVPGYCTHYTIISDKRPIAEVVSGQAYFGPMSANSLLIHNSNFSDVASFKAALAADPIVVIYPKDTATTSQKTPTPVTPAKGTNYIASTNEVPASNIEVGYFKKTP